MSKLSRRERFESVGQGGPLNGCVSYVVAPTSHSPGHFLVVVVFGIDHVDGLAFDRTAEGQPQNDYAGGWGRASEDRNERNHVLESVRRLQAGLQSFLSMRRIEARRKNASAFRLRFSQSLASLRQRLSHAMVRSTIQRLGKTTNPLA